MPRLDLATRLVAVGAAAGLVVTAAASKLAAEAGPAPPDFSSNDAAWVLAERNGDYIPIAGGPSPTRNDPAYPHIGNGTGAQPAYRIADLANPNIKPWAKAIMKRENDKVLAGGMGYSARQSCMPAGVPAFMGYSVVESIHFLQTPKEVTMIFRAMSRSAASISKCRIRRTSSHPGMASRSAITRATRLW
jgi:hypothetical protein